MSDNRNTPRNFVSIFLQGEMHCGKVISAANYYDYTRKNADGKFADDWYIEFACALCASHHYLKQVQDGYADATVRFYETEIEMRREALDEI